MKKINISIFFLLLANAMFAQLPQLGRDNIDDVIAAMTLDEKIYIVMGLGDENWTNPPNGKETVIVNGIAGRTWDIQRLGIPLTIMADGPAGLRINPNPEGATHTYYCTAFPTSTALASSWNIDLVTQVGQAMGNEVLEYGCDALLTPAMNIQRNPLCGRNFEYYSEDPLLSGKMGAAIVKGIQSNGVGTSVKHFIANNQETNRKSINEIISQRALREIYLKGFEITIKESAPWTVMSSYNRVNGFHTAENRELLTTILRNEWGFGGMVTTDWWSGTDATSQMYAGNDMLMPGCYQREELKKAIEDRRLDEATLDRNVKRILEYIVKTPRFNGYKYSNSPDLEAHNAIACNAAEESMILLKNKDKTLPFKKVKNIALFGKTSYNFIAGGTGSGEVNYKHAVSLKEGLESAGYNVVKPLEICYNNWIDSVRMAAKQDDRKHALDFVKEMSLSDNLIRPYVNNSDIAIITIGRNAGEGWDRKEDDYFVLSSEEKDLIRNVSELYHAAGKKVVVIMNIGGAIETDSWKQYPDAILLAWQTGQQGGIAIANLLDGKMSPSGKLAVTFPLKYADVPSSSTFPGEPENDPINSFYNDGIYVGYRYFDTFEVQPSYEFGFGLSYTTFSYSDLKLSSDIFNDKIDVELTVTNTGKIAGKDVVELYLSAPQDKIEKPVQELKGFAKTRLLKPGEKQTINLTINAADLASFWSGVSEWRADAGQYEVRIGASSKDIRLSAPFKLEKDRIIEKVNYTLQPNFFVKEISIKDKVKTEVK